MLYWYDAHQGFHCPQRQDRPGRIDVSRNDQRFCHSYPLGVQRMVPGTECRVLGILHPAPCTWRMVPGTWYKVLGILNLVPNKYLALLTWYLICMTLSSLQVSIKEGGWEHCLSAPPFTWGINTWYLRLPSHRHQYLIFEEIKCHRYLPIGHYYLIFLGGKLWILPSHMPSILDSWGKNLLIALSHL